jgi:hypothetical protein
MSTDGLNTFTGGLNSQAGGDGWLEHPSREDEGQLEAEGVTGEA